MTDIILSEIKNGVGIITLNSPKSLNSISLEMARALIAKLDEWKTNKEVHCLFLQGNEKAFCAGGDVRKLYEALKNNPPGTVAAGALEFFIEEYTLDYTIHTYKKPIIAWGDGIVMGGGIGILVGASHRIMTEKSKLAMPEITIGLYPDVAGTWFLNRMPEGWGNYFGLTGARMNGADALYLGLADYFLTSDLKESVMQKLMTQNWNKDAGENIKILDTLFEDFATTPTQSPVKDRKAFGNKLSKINSVLEFRSLLEEEALHDEWTKAGLLTFKAGSPTSAMVIYEQLQRGKNLNLKQVFCSELNLSVHFSLHTDFPEGVRALLIDKDQKPNWQPPTLEEVGQASVETYFTPLWNSKDHPLSSFICEDK
jgi:enoyl-CoA hydratase/carnithine racemase